MSTWTHVAGVIRVDGLYGHGFKSKEIDLGNMCSYDDDADIWDACDIPCGSEGSLIHSLWKNPEASSLAARTATIFGDLRDYDDVDEILDYFNRVIADVSVRQGCFTVQVGSTIRTFNYSHETRSFKEIIPCT